MEKYHKKQLFFRMPNIVTEETVDVVIGCGWVDTLMV